MGLNFLRGRDADSLHAVQMQINGHGKAQPAHTYQPERTKREKIKISL